MPTASRRTGVFVVAALLALAAACQTSEPVATDEVIEVAPAPTDAAAAPVEQAKPARRFLAVEGEVTVDGAPASVGAAIGENASIETGKDGSAIVTFEPGSIFKIRSASKIVLGTSARKQVSVKLALGSLWSFLAPGTSYEVETPNAIAGVRGTTFFVEASKKQGTYVCDCDGDVEMQSTDGKFHKVIESKNAHKGFRFVPHGKREKVKKAKRQGHTDAEGDAIMAFIPETKAP